MTTTTRTDDGRTRTTPSFLIAVPTYRRPDGLRRLLSSFEGLSWPPSWRFDGVLVVDNDPEGSARSVVDDLRAASAFPLRYVAEATPGVVAARNRALREAEAVTHVAMVDDDEIIRPGWPRGLLEVAERTGADLTCGDVDPLPEAEVPSWMLRPLYLGRVTHPDGAAVDRITSGNLLIRRGLLDDLDPVFDDRFGRTGGEDSFLSAVVRARGGDLRWSASSPTWEVLPAERCSLTWLARRWRRNGATMTLVQLALVPSPARRAWLRLRALAIGSVRVLYGAVAPARPGGRTEPARAEALRQRMQGLGQITGALGRRPVAYGPGGFESPS